jgi:hypothetical protein
MKVDLGWISCVIFSYLQMRINIHISAKRGLAITMMAMAQINTIFICNAGSVES